MQDKYVSLNPENTEAEEKTIRSNLWRQRLDEADGGEGAKMLGYQFGFTAGVLTYA